MQSGHNATAELIKYGLFWKLSKNYGFHRNQCKMQIIYGIATQGLSTLFQIQNHLFTVYATFFILCRFCFPILSSIVCTKQKGKHVLKKMEIIRVWHTVSSEAYNENRWTSAFQAASRKCFKCEQQIIQYPCDVQSVLMRN